MGEYIPSLPSKRAKVGYPHLALEDGAIHKKIRRMGRKEKKEEEKHSSQQGDWNMSTEAVGDLRVHGLILHDTFPGRVGDPGVWRVCEGRRYLREHKKENRNFNR